MPFEGPIGWSYSPKCLCAAALKHALRIASSLQLLRFFERFRFLKSRGIEVRGLIPIVPPEGIEVRDFVVECWIPSNFIAFYEFEFNNDDLRMEIEPE